MGLREYQRKRNFSVTPEPRGTESADKEGWRFVVQKHDATRMHYDFRLELKGVLKSWAIPKGPSLDPADKRLGIHTEDHPLEYADFEGVIPDDEYGGGPVLVWDRGTWRPVGDPDKGYHSGSLKFVLEGEKLRGGFALVKIRGRDSRDQGKAWLLIKERDAEARPGSNLVAERPESVLTGRLLEQVEAEHDRIWHSNRAPARAVRAARTRPGARKVGRVPDPAALAGARKGRLPASLRPQLATLASEPPRGDDWLHELKFDGFRIVARLQSGRARLLSRNGKDWTDRFPVVARSLERLPGSQALIDGEVAVVRPDGTTSFQALQNVLTSPVEGELTYFVFDLLHLDGYDLTGVALEQRKAALQQLLAAAPPAGCLRFSDHVVGSGQEFFRTACGHALEGIVSKRRDSRYEPGRGHGWLKLKCVARQEFVIGGFTEPRGSRAGIGALLVGVYDDKGRLQYAGKVGTGFSAATLRELRWRLEPLEQKQPAFAPPVPREAKAHWVRPELVAEVAFTEWTHDGRLRHPSFQGLREDKPAAEVVREVPVAARRAAAAAAAPAAQAPARARTSKATARVRRRHDGSSEAAESPPKRLPPQLRSRTAARRSAPKVQRRGRAEAAQEPEAEVAGVRLTHPDRVLFPAQGVTKRDLARFYESIADWILPHLRGRPLTLVRCPEGAGKECFFMKHSGVWAPAALRRVRIREKTKLGEYLVADSLAGLVSLVQMGVLEVHTWNSVTQHLERPDRLVLDLDPGPHVEWARLVQAARRIRERLRALGLESFLKTTGGKGLHVVVPLSPRHGWDECLDFSRALAEDLVRAQPREYTTAMPKAGRSAKILLDYLRNNRGNTSIAAYSTRARPGAPLSVPIAWEELAGLRSSEQYSLANLKRRLASLRADPWAGYAELDQRVTPAMWRALGAR